MEHVPVCNKYGYMSLVDLQSAVHHFFRMATVKPERGSLGGRFTAGLRAISGIIYVNEFFICRQPKALGPTSHIRDNHKNELVTY
jgi:hypothetical protein